MKQIQVNSNCDGCGLCIVNSNYLQEDAEGNATPIIGKVIHDSDLEHIKQVIAECPCGALKIIETGSTKKKGSAGVTEIVANLKNKCKDFKVEEISYRDVRLNIKEYDIPVPTSNLERKRGYSSESKIKSAAKDEFNRLCYSETAYRPMLKKVFVEYKVNVLKPYYTCTDTDDSAYFVYNEQIRKLLADAYAEIDDVLEGNHTIPESWKNFSHYLSKKDDFILTLSEFDGRSTSSGIMSEFRSGAYSGLNDYVNYLDFDYDETYLGESSWGGSKYKQDWWFSGFGEQAREYIKDLKFAIDMKSDDIEEHVASDVNTTLRWFEHEVKEVLKEKISELEVYLKK